MRSPCPSRLRRRRSLVAASDWHDRLDRVEIELLSICGFYGLIWSRVEELLPLLLLPRRELVDQPWLLTRAAGDDRSPVLLFYRTEDHTDPLSVARPNARDS